MLNIFLMNFCLTHFQARPFAPCMLYCAELHCVGFHILHVLQKKSSLFKLLWV
jgi:hypothetical protein